MGRTVAVMQPYFFPYAGYFSLIKHTNRFIVLDTVQFIKSGWINRNRLLKQGGGSIWFNVPLLQRSHNALINTVLIDNTSPWKAKIMAQIAPYKRIAPNYAAVRDLVERALSPDHQSITALNTSALEMVCEYLGFARTFEILSDTNLAYRQPEAPDEWALNICKAIGDVNAYWNQPGGQSFYNRSKYEAAGIDLKFLNLVTPEYDQTYSEFTPHLSIIDTLMFNTPFEVNAMLDRYVLS